MRDDEMISMLENRNQEVFTHLTEAYGRLMRHIAVNILRSDEDAEECVNDAMLKIWDTIPPAKPESLLSYTAMVVRGLAINRYSSRGAKKRGQPAAPLDELGDILPAPESPEEQIEAKELAAAINAFLGSLDQDSRVLFIRRYWYCDSVPELAKAFAIRENALNVRLFRIRKKLRQHLERSSLL